MNVEIFTTSDGSHSLKVSSLNESYHSKHGAIQESSHVFIDAGFKMAIRHWKRLKILEVGLGTGLNALLTKIESGQLNIKIDYTAIEPFPLSNDIIGQLNYPRVLNRPKEDFQRIHQTSPGAFHSLSPHFHFKKIDSPFEITDLSGQFNLVYFDAFAPEVQPELWTPTVFEKIFAHLCPSGILTTYCAKGTVRRMLQKAGFKTERLPGPPGKREMLRATKP